MHIKTFAHDFSAFRSSVRFPCKLSSGRPLSGFTLHNFGFGTKSLRCTAWVTSHSSKQFVFVLWLWLFQISAMAKQPWLINRQNFSAGGDYQRHCNRKPCSTVQTVQIVAGHSPSTLFWTAALLVAVRYCMLISQLNFTLTVSRSLWQLQMSRRM